ncbi:integrase, catalytic region, zinc finger, CCHC-type containing protein [Tanacetum coccineum]
MNRGNNARGAGVAGYGGAQNRVGNANPGQAKQVKCYNCNGIGHITRNCTQPKHPQNSEYFKDKILLMQAKENGMALDEEQLLFIAGGQDNVIDEDVDEQLVQDLALNVDNVFQADDCDAFDSDVDEAPTAQTTIRILFDNAMPVVQSNVSSVPNDAYMMIFNDMHEPHAQYVSDTTRNTVVDNSLIAELATYKEYAELYERRSKFELTEREQKIDEQLRIVITNHNIKEEKLKKELHSVKMQLASTINHNKSMSHQDERKKLSKETTPQAPIKACVELHQLGSLNGKRDFEQTKECYLTEVIPFFKTLKEHFEGIQKALTKEIKEMKDIFKELEAEVDQNVVNRKHDEIERKNLLIANNNLIVDCLSKEVFNIAMNSELTVSRFTEMHEAYTIVQTRCLELEAELSKLRDKAQKDDHTELVKLFQILG